MSFKYIIVRKTRTSKERLNQIVYDDKGPATLAIREAKDPNKWRIKRISNKEERMSIVTQDHEKPVKTKEISWSKVPSCNNCRHKVHKTYPESNGSRKVADIACAHCSKGKGCKMITSLHSGRKSLVKWSNFEPFTNAAYKQNAIAISNAYRNTSKGSPFSSSSRGKVA